LFIVNIKPLLIYSEYGNIVIVGDNVPLLHSDVPKLI